MSAKSKTIVITGGTGFIGEALAERFLNGHDVHVLDIREPGDEIADRVRFTHCDVTSDASVRDAVQEVAREAPGGIASVIHLIAYYDFAGEPSDLYDRITVRGTERLLRALRESEATIEQFVFSSTMLVHRPSQRGQPIREDDPLEARWDYPESKIRTERVIHEQREGIPAVSLRIAGVYTDFCNSIPLSRQIQRIHEKRLTAQVYPGDTTHGQAFVHLDDVADAFDRTVQRRDTLPEDVPILIGEPQTFAYDTIQRRLAKLLHDRTDWDTEEIPKAMAKAGAWVQGQVPGVEDPFIKPWMIDLADDHYELDITRARELLGWEPARSLLETLPKMVEALRRDPTEWYDAHGIEAPAAQTAQTSRR